MLPTRRKRNGEAPGPWLTVEQNVWLARLCTADEAPWLAAAADLDAVIDSRAGCRTIEVFAGLVPVGWG
jgi:hypothetical protein